MKYVKVKEDNEELYFERERESYGHQIYGRRVETPNAEWRQSIAEIKENRSLIIYSLFPPVIRESSQQDIQNPFNEEITNMIQRGTAIAASDASVKDGCMGGCWIIANSGQQKTLMTNKLYHNQ